MTLPSSRSAGMRGAGVDLIRVRWREKPPAGSPGATRMSRRRRSHAMMRAPTILGRSVRRMVSTSGSSGTGDDSAAGPRNCARRGP